MSLFSRVIIKINNIKIYNRICPTIWSQFHSCQQNFAGHSKWANIKHTKALKDGERSAMFTKLSRQIRLAIQDGGSTNPTKNSILKSAIDLALRKNMPMSTIQNIIKKFEESKIQLKKYILEIRASQKIYIVCVLYTDNFAGLKMNLAPIVKKAGGAYTDVLHLFEDRGIIETKVDEKLKCKANTAAELMELCTEDAIESSAEEVEVVDYENGLVSFLCNPIDIDRICADLTGKGYSIESAEHAFIPKVCVTVPERDFKAYEVFRDKLKAVEGIEEIYDNIQPIEAEN